MNAYFVLTSAIERLKLTDTEVATYAAALRRRMNAAVDVSTKGGPMPPMDPLIDDLEQRLGIEACDSVLHWRTTVAEILARIAGERFIAHYSTPGPRNVLVGPEAGECV